MTIAVVRCNFRCDSKLEACESNESVDRARRTNAAASRRELAFTETFTRFEFRDREFKQLGEELEETNKGVMALYAELDDQARALREAVDLKSRFLSYMSHEFRTPLGSIRSVSRILLDRMDGPLSDEQDKQVRFIQSSAAELSEMVDDLLDLAKIEAGQISVSPAWFEMVRNLRGPLAGKCSSRCCRTMPSNSCSKNRPTFRRFTPTIRKLSQILRNYISNALKFTPEGEIRVTARLDGPDHVTFSVADTGIGIHPRPSSGRISRFHSRSIRQFNENGQGTGLRTLLSAKKPPNSSAARVFMTSELGVGSTFQVTIPIRLSDAEKVSKPRRKARNEAGQTPPTESQTCRIAVPRYPGCRRQSSHAVFDFARLACAPS